MSIEGGRVDYRENCRTILDLPESQGDGMQKSVCRASTRAGVVAAAGNDGINANESAPGGYDQVISVAAMTDTDGVGWEKGPTPAAAAASARRTTPSPAIATTERMSISWPPAPASFDRLARQDG